MIATLLLAMLLCAPATSANRCTCIGPPARVRTGGEAADVVRRADAVFEGTVLSVRGVAEPAPADDPRTLRLPMLIDATVVVHRRWKGPESDTIVVRTGATGGMCGVPLGVGDRYLFVAHQVSTTDGPASSLQLGICGISGLTRPWDREADRISRLFGPAR